MLCVGFLVVLGVEVRGLLGVSYSTVLQEINDQI